MSYHSFWPSYKTNKLRGTGELLWKVARLSYKVDRIGVPLLLVPTIFLFAMSGTKWVPNRTTPNPYIEAVKKKKAEGKYDGDNVGIRPHHYA